MPNTKFVSMACMPNEPKSVKCKNGIMYLSLCVCVHMCDHVPFINLVYLACMPIELKSAKCDFLKKNS